MLSKYRIIEMHIGQHMVWIPIITVRLFEQDIDYYSLLPIRSIELRESAYRVTMD